MTPFAHSWPSKYDGQAVTVMSTGERVALMEIAPLTFVWRPAAQEPQAPFIDPATEPAPAGNHPR